MTPLQNAGDWISAAPLRTRAVSLIHVPEGGEPTQANDLSGKRAILELTSGMTLVLWTGKYHTIARRLTGDERRQVTEALR